MQNQSDFSDLFTETSFVNIQMTREQMNDHFVTITIGILALAALTGIFVVCAAKCFRHVPLPRRTKQRRSLAIPGQTNSKSPLIYCSKSGAISIDCPELDYIDSTRNADLISSTVQVNSIHSSPVGSTSANHTNKV
ncbi:hypothetical protein DdX_04101 [Ditylenchus destructor]|uniref:Uncharacterized protein n=1 Tax=Ditylenchus destructor TaxID=166010 RepID=A0AAD4NDQ1_9BILA|nr:hypothetical protein DdX_04101 [Ditylenchus destructor]